MSIDNIGISIRLGQENDIDQILELNSKWLQENLSEEQKLLGFLTCDLFSKNDIEQMILNREIVVAINAKTVVAYYLFDNNSETKSLKLINEIITNLIEQRLLPSEGVSRRAQVVIDADFQNQGLYNPLISFLHKHLSQKYQSVFSIVYKDNPKIASHLKVGWKIISEDSERYFVTHEVN